MTFTKVWQDTAAAHFPGAPAGNVANGTWDGTPFTDAEVATLATVADLDTLARWLAVMIIMPNGEENLSTGEDDDYAAAFVSDGTTAASSRCRTTWTPPSASAKTPSPPPPRASTTHRGRSPRPAAALPISR
jgi:hypothetical protein